MAQQEVPVNLSVLDTLPIHSWPYPRVMLGVLTERAISHADHAFWSLVEIFAQSPTYMKTPYGRTDVVRNQMALELLRSTSTHLLMLDSDHEHPSNIIQSLARWPLLFDDVKVVCGMNFRRKEPYDPVMGNLTADGERPIVTQWQKGLMPVDECGAASLLVHREVFETLPFPWFQNIYDPKYLYKHSWPGEDIYFARKCKEYGYTFYVDTTTTSPHCTTSMVTEETFRRYMQMHPEEFRDEQ